MYSEYGTADVLQVDRIEKPVHGNDEILIRIRAAEVTKADCEMRSFNFQYGGRQLIFRLHQHT